MRTFMSPSMFDVEMRARISDFARIIDSQSNFGSFPPPLHCFVPSTFPIKPKNCWCTLNASTLCADFAPTFQPKGMPIADLL